MMMANTGVSNDPGMSQARLEQIVMVSHNEIYLVSDPDLQFEFANATATRNLGFVLPELRKMKFTDLFSFPDEMAMNALLNSVRTGKSDRLNLQLKFSRKNGTAYDAEVHIQALDKDQTWLVIVTDITNRLTTEKKLLETIYEKETLIKEIHHRVKNNLQLISSIIFLKLSSVEQPDIRSFLEDTRQKIRSISLIHERLLQAEHLDKVEIAEYLGKLIHDLEVTYFREGLSLKIDKNLESMHIGLDTAIICGLIVNELITNAIKHAFAGRNTGLLEITFRKSGDKLLLTVADDGVSLPPHISPGISTSFGMQLIDIFVKQLNGTLSIARKNGTTFIIEF